MTFGGSTNVKDELRTVQAILGNGIKKNNFDFSFASTS
jgi:hypothetical protein